MNKQNDKNSGMHINPVAAAAVTGAVVGAGVAAVGAVVMQDEKNREKVKDVLSNVKDQAHGYMENVHKATDDQKGKIESKSAGNKSANSHSNTK